ncbi:MAG: hypothetical protein H0X02_01335 [Nitrosomonas sp.]|nr:hypothetical protein [Nitrosomonas sp.]
MTVLRYMDGKLAVLHGPRKIAIFDETGLEIKKNEKLVRKSTSASQ